MPTRKSLIAAVTAAIALAAAAPASAQTPAPTGGASFGGEGDDGDDGLVVEPGTLLGRELRISGTLPSLGSARVRVERRDSATDTWTPVASATAAADGSFTAVWETDVLGQHALRAVADTASASAVAAASDLPSATTTVFKPARATWYGPGFWGRTTACGIKLTKSTIGVAHKTLPCGTRVGVFLDGRRIELPVIDRGPYARGMTLDLTQAAAESIGMTQTVRLGWVRLAEPVPTDDER